MKNLSWFAGPYPWLVSSIAFLLPSINYFIKGDTIGGVIFLISAILFFINFLGRYRQKLPKMKLDKIFKLTWKRLLIIIAAWFVAAVLHNVFYALTGIEEPVFFLLSAPLIPLYLLISIVYTLVRKIKK